MKANRDALIQRFEATVKQEIINHNKAVEAHNQAVNRVSNDLASLSVRHDQQCFDTRDRFFDMQRQINVVSDNIDDLERHFRAFKEGIEKKQFHEAKTWDDLFEALRDIEDEIEALVAERKKPQVIDHSLIEQQVSSVNDSMERMRAQTAKTLGDCYKKLEAMESAHNLFGEMVYEKLDLAFKEVEGINKKVGAMGSTLSYEQKKIEDLYTQIKRLKESR